MSRKLLFCAFEGAEKSLRMGPGLMGDVRKAKQSNLRVGCLGELEQSVVEATAGVDRTSRGEGVVLLIFSL